LVVEDEVDIVDLLQSLLKAEGYQVISAFNGEDALKLVDKYTPDLILLDMNMPQMGGISFYHKIYDRAHERAKYPVLVLTGRTNMEKLFAELNVDGFLTKPFDIDRLLAEIRTIIGKRQALVVPESAEASKAAADDARKQKQVLIVDNDPKEFERIAMSFLSAGYIVNAASSGITAFERACASAPDMILVRMDLPDMPGDILAYKLRHVSNTSHIPVILYTYSTQALERNVTQEICKRVGLREPLESPPPEALVKESELVLNRRAA